MFYWCSSIWRPEHGLFYAVDLCPLGVNRARTTCGRTPSCSRSSACAPRCCSATQTPARGSWTSADTRLNWRAAIRLSVASLSPNVTFVCFCFFFNWFLVVGGAVLTAQRRAGVVLGHGSPRGIPGGFQQRRPQALPTAGLDQHVLPQEDDSTAQTHRQTEKQYHLWWGVLWPSAAPFSPRRRRKPTGRASTRSCWPTARCARTSGPSSGTSAWSASWTRRCGWRSGWLTPAAWPPPP